MPEMSRGSRAQIYCCHTPLLALVSFLVIAIELQGGGSIAGALAPDSCPAGSAGCGGETEVSRKCVKWRQTGGCSPAGPRENNGDRSCNDEIPPGNSGYCQCGVGEQKIRAREVTCDHRPFTCATECLQAQRYTCVSWRQTGGCSADGPPEPDRDADCSHQVDARSSGFCECGGGRFVRRPGCDYGEYEEPFTCRDVCAQESDLYEELGVDKGATDKVIKQTFRKLSLKYHPDKTQNDPVLTARFAAIREAYDIIGDPEKRAIYDVAGLKMVYEIGKVGKGPEMSVPLVVSLENMYNGLEHPLRIQRTIICRGCADSNSQRCRKCNVKCANEVEVRNVQMGPMVMQQEVEVPSKQKCRKENTDLVVMIEPGIMAGETILFKSMGQQDPNKLPGDVKVTVKEASHSKIKRTGVDLHTDITISLREALLGFERALTHLDGRTIRLSFNGVTKPSGVIRIEGEGMPYRGDPTQRGNLFVKCHIEMPQDGKEWIKSNSDCSDSRDT